MNVIRSELFDSEVVEVVIAFSLRMQSNCTDLRSGKELIGIETIQIQHPIGEQGAGDARPHCPYLLRVYRLLDQPSALPVVVGRFWNEGRRSQPAEGVVLGEQRGRAL